MTATVTTGTRSHVLITANSPGEVAGWVLPVAESLRALNPEAEIILVLPPCQYASGKEARVVADWPAIQRVVTLRGLSGALLLGRKALGLSRDADARVLFLGGDVFHAVSLARRIGARCYAYLPKPRWSGSLDKSFVPDAAAAERFAARGVPTSRYEVVGQLALDSVRRGRQGAEVRRDLGIGQDAPLIVLLPGSRPLFSRFLIPYLAQVAAAMHAHRPGLQFVACLSPFLGDDLLDDPLQDTWPPGQGRQESGSAAGGAALQFTTQPALDVIAAGDLAIAIPGTTTLQIAALGVPQIVFLPLQRPDLIPLEGLLGLLPAGVWPVTYLRRRVTEVVGMGPQPMALPNMIAGRRIVPELRGHIEPVDVAAQALGLLEDEDRRRKMVGECLEITAERGAAERIAAGVLA